MQVAWVGPNEPPPPEGGAGARAVVAVVEHNAASLRAVQWALANIYRAGDTLHLVHVVPPAAALANGLTAHAASYEELGGGDAAAELLERTRGSIERAFVTRVRSVARGAPAAGSASSAGGGGGGGAGACRYCGRRGTGRRNEQAGAPRARRLPHAPAGPPRLNAPFHTPAPPVPRCRRAG